MHRDSFVFYRSFYEALSELEGADKLKAVDALLEYGLNGAEYKGRGAVAMFFRLVKPQIDANNQRYENGRRGGRPKTENKPSENLKKTEAEPNVNVNDNVNDNVNVNVNVKNKKAAEVVADAPDIMQEALKAFIEHRKALKKPMTAYAMTLTIKKALELGGGDPAVAVKVINQSIAKGWLGLFPLDKKNVDELQSAWDEFERRKEAAT